MAHFYARIQGRKGEATRCGAKSSGIHAEASGWHIGTRSELRYDPTLDTDVVQVYLTGGSSGNYSQLIAEFYRDGDSFKCTLDALPKLYPVLQEHGFLYMFDDHHMTCTNEYAYFEFDDVKWYPDYKEVSTIESCILELGDSAGLLRIGEDIGDVEELGELFFDYDVHVEVLSETAGTQCLSDYISRHYPELAV